MGLPTEDDMGNSEVGHNALGAGRIFAQGSASSFLIIFCLPIEKSCFCWTSFKRSCRLLNLKFYFGIFIC